MRSRIALLLFVSVSILAAPALADDPEGKRTRAPLRPEAPDDGKKDFDYAVDLQGNLYKIDCAKATFTKMAQVRIPPKTGAGPAETPTLCDLAATPDGYLYGISDTSLYLINQQDPTKSKNLGNHGLTGPWGMTAVGTDLMINTSGGQVYLVDRKTAKAKHVGAMGGSLGASGDMAYVGETIFSSVKDSAGKETLVRIDPKTGKATRVGVLRDPMGGSVQDVYGLIDQKGLLYGVCADGRIVRIETSNARCVVIKRTSTTWWGATSFTRF